jgi:hypothetical protein
MQAKPLFAALVAAAFAFPLAANAAGTDKPKSASAGPASANGGNDGGAEAMFKSLDKDSDGSITKAEALGTPHHAEFDKLDKNGDGKLSREEHAAAPDHAAAKAKDGSGSANGSSAASTSGEKKTY